MVMVAKKISTSAYWNGPDAYGSLADVQQYYIDKGEVVKHDNLGLVGTAGLGYRRLSKHGNTLTSALMYSMTMHLRINFLVLVQA